MRLPVPERMQTAAARAVHLSLAVLFLTVAIPLKVSDRWITIGWLAEGVALLWVSARLADTDSPDEKTGTSIHRVIRRLASVALTLGFFGLLSMPYWFDRSVREAVINRRFTTEIAGVVAFALAACIAGTASKTVTTKETAFFPSWLQLASLSIGALNVVAIQSGILEIRTFWSPGSSNIASANASLQTALSISAFLMLYGAGLLAAGFWRRNAFVRWQGLGLLIIAILKTFLYDVRSLSQGYRVASFLGLGALLMAVSFAYVRKGVKTPLDGQS